MPLCRLGDQPVEAAAEAGWSSTRACGDDGLAAALEDSEAKASALDLENARLRLALVWHRFYVVFCISCTAPPGVPDPPHPPDFLPARFHLYQAATTAAAPAN